MRLAGRTLSRIRPSYFVNSALNRDYTMAMGTVLLYSGLLISLNLLVDVLYAVIDPRVDLA